MAPNILRCPHCNAPLTRVDGKDPIDCPYCHAALVSAPVVPVIPQAPKPPVAIILGAGLAIVGVVIALFVLTGSKQEVVVAPQPAAAVVTAPPPEPPKPAPPPEPPSPVKKVLSFGEEGTNAGQLHEPSQLAVASDGTVFVADSRSGRVQRFGPDGAYQDLITLPDDKLTKQHGVFGMTTDAAGKLYVNRVGDVLVYDAATLKLVRTLAGDYPDRYYHGGLAVDASGTVYALTDRMGDVDLVITNKAGKVLSRRRASSKDVAVDGTGRVFLAHDDGLEVQDAKGAVQAKVGGSGARSIAFDGQGHVFLATGSSVDVVSAEGVRLTSLPVPASDIALDTKGRLYALERGTVSIYEVTLP